MENVPAFNNNEKQIRWQEQASLIERTIDGKGMPLDEGIKETVIGLNLLGFHTTGSCEGHIDWATGAPYIDIEDKDSADLQAKAKKIRDDKEELKLLWHIHQNEQEARKKIVELIDEFYSQHQCPPLAKLGIHDTDLNWSRLESAGAEQQDDQPQEIKKQRLLEFQNEMKAFTEFLKQKFLLSNNKL